MCSFIFTSRNYPDLGKINHYLQFRGPDHTTVKTLNGYHFIHNLLSITGDFTPQPFLQDEVACFYNGQIYNYLDLQIPCRSDGEVLIPLYQEYGPKFVTQLDGEFALVLVDFKNQLLLISSDTFATKPLWYAIEEGDVGVASYPSALYQLGFKNPQKSAANTTLVFRLSDYALLQTHPITQFDLSQHKDHYDDWLQSFSKAIQKRCSGTREKIFIGLSSGYDSGALASELKKQDINFRAFSLRADENTEILSKRLEQLPQAIRLSPSESDYRDAKSYIETHCETILVDDYNFKKDKGAVGVSLISHAAKNTGYLIHLSGQGADEILSDYGRFGEKIYSHSTLAGVFPADLDRVFPWPNFFGGTQTHYLLKEECVGGAYGLETRYPFLDKTLVQEFLWLSPALKNQYYKAPLHVYLDRENFPFNANEKIGFRANKNLQPSAESFMQKIKRWF